VSYEQTIARLYELQVFGIKLGLNATTRLLERLGNPHKRFKCVHLAGTNAKGSVAAMVEATLVAAGIPCGLYTSPHLVEFTERIRVGGREITKAEVVELAEEVWDACVPGEPPTFFEFVTAMAFSYFAKRGVELAVVETGMGGRLDATNVCHPAVTVITNVGMDHQQYLGRTLRAIAREKAGILKPGVPLVHGVGPGVAREVVEGRAAELKCKVLRLGRDLKARWAGERFNLFTPSWSLKGLHCALAGAHQARNAALAAGVVHELEAQGWAVSPQDLREGLGRVRWPGRLERWVLPEGYPELWLDGAHNPPAARTLVEALKKMGKKDVVMVVGVMADKDIPALVRTLARAARHMVLTRPRYERAANPEVLAEALGEGASWEVVGELGAAIERAMALAGARGVVVVSGSLFTVGEARAWLSGHWPRKEEHR